MDDRPQLGPDQVALEALAVGTQEELCRPCVDCGLYTGCYCDGNDWGECFAADRLPQEHWANNQRAPLCTSCDRRFNMCHFCRGLLWAVPPAHRDPDRYTAVPGGFPSEALTSRSLPRWRRRLPALSISLLRTILADMMMRSSGKLLSEPGDILLAKLGALYFPKRNLRRPQPRSRPTENFRLAWRGIRPAPAARRPKRPQMRLFAQPSGI